MAKIIDEFKKSSFPEALGQFQPNLHKTSLNDGNSRFLNDGPLLFPKGDNYEIVKIY